MVIYLYTIIRSTQHGQTVLVSTNSDAPLLGNETPTKVFSLCFCAKPPATTTSYMQRCHCQCDSTVQSQNYPIVVAPTEVFFFLIFIMLMYSILLNICSTRICHHITLWTNWRTNSNPIPTIWCKCFNKTWITLSIYTSLYIYHINKQINVL